MEFKHGGSKKRGMELTTTASNKRQNIVSQELSQFHSLNSISTEDCLRSLDLKKEGFQTEISTFISRETTPSSQDSDKIESKIPPEEEIEEFFSVAEKYEQKRFADKYNFDIQKDVPFEGRYQWVRLKP